MTALRAVRGDGVGALAERVLAEIDPLIVEIGAALRREIPEYDELSESDFTLDILPVSRHLVSTFVACLVEEREPTPRELGVFTQCGERRLAMGLPLESVLHAFRIGGREAWRSTSKLIPDDEPALLGSLSMQWMDLVDRSSMSLTQGYVAASHERLRHVDARRRELVEALLSADDASEVASVSLRFSTVLASSYVPVLVHGAGSIETILRDWPPGTLAGQRGPDVLLLVPHRVETVRPRPGTLTCWGQSVACGAALRDEVHHVEQLLLTALAEGQDEGAFGPDDLLVEQLLLGNARVAKSLRRGVVEALSGRDPGGSLLATLRTFLDTGSVPETARREVVHPNTVSYRLGRVRDLTGLDPRLPRESALLVLGLGLPQEEQHP
ncbi:MAG: putative transcriptional regulator [Frankiales bacterium]|nr:putative transcriptional regulator [Frankiales bacterium]